MTKDDRYLLDKVEFYITNVCNLNCDQCNRFNDYKFAGWQRWSDYADVHRRWAEVVDIKQIVILGGEPLLNPSINEWIVGLSKLWKRPVQILTNGTRLNHTPGLYETLLSWNPDPIIRKHWIGISVHNMSDKDFLVQEARKFLRGEIKTSTDKANIYGADLALVDGTLNKCGPAPLFPEFDQQHPLSISSADRELINAYKPYTIDQVEQQGTDILKNIDLVLPQCKFCPGPSDMKNRKIYATLKNKTIPISQIRATELHGLQ
jgi:hypothetical protein